MPDNHNGSDWPVASGLSGELNTADVRLASSITDSGALAPLPAVPPPLLFREDMPETKLEVQKTPLYALQPAKYYT